MRFVHNLANEIKKFNEKKQFQQALDLFRDYQRKNPKMITDFAIVQALKSASNLKDFQYGSNT